MLYPDSAAIEQSLPTVVTHALRSANITFSLHPSHSVDPALRVHALVLQHLQQKQLVIIPRHHLLDLAQLNAQTGNAWQALTPSNTAALLSNYHLATLPAIPALFKLPCLYAASLLTPDNLYIESGVDNLLIGLSAAALATLLTNAQAIECSHPIAFEHPNHSPVASDAHLIEESVLTLSTRRNQKRL